MFYIALALVFCVLLLIFGWICLNRYLPFGRPVGKKTAPQIICLMITGKDEERIKFARRSIQNFKDQDYPNKVLVIINHSLTKVIDKDEDSITEFYIDKTKLTLGDLRNIALEMVPINALWTPWDDDDIRSKQYLSTLYKEMKKHDADVVAYTDRLEHNFKKDFTWHSRLNSGFVQVLAKQDKRIQYLQKDSMEDLQLFEDFKKNDLKVHVLKNDPSIYIRLVHGNNTSLYINYEKDADSIAGRNDGNYQEFPSTKKETGYVKTMIKRYFDFIV